MPEPEPPLEFRNGDDAFDSAEDDANIISNKPEPAGAAKTASPGGIKDEPAIKMIIEMFDGEILTQK